MKFPQPNFTLILRAIPKLLGQKKSKFIIRSKLIVRSKLFAARKFSLYRHFITATTTDIDMFLHV